MFNIAKVIILYVLLGYGCFPYLFTMKQYGVMYSSVLWVLLQVLDRIREGGVGKTRILMSVCASCWIPPKIPCQ